METLHYRLFINISMAQRDFSSQPIRLLSAQFLTNGCLALMSRACREQHTKVIKDPGTLVIRANWRNSREENKRRGKENQQVSLTAVGNVAWTRAAGTDVFVWARRELEHAVQKTRRDREPLRVRAASFCCVYHELENMASFIHRVKFAFSSERRSDLATMQRRRGGPLRVHVRRSSILHLLTCTEGAPMTDICHKCTPIESQF